MSRNPLLTSYLKTRYVVIIPVINSYFRNALGFRLPRVVPRDEPNSVDSAYRQPEGDFAAGQLHVPYLSSKPGCSAAFPGTVVGKSRISLHYGSLHSSMFGGQFRNEDGSCVNDSVADG